MEGLNNINQVQSEDFWNKCVEVVTEANSGLVFEYAGKSFWISVSRGYEKLSGTNLCPTVLVELSEDLIGKNESYDSEKHQNVISSLKRHLNVDVVVIDGTRSAEGKWNVLPLETLEKNTIYVLRMNKNHYQLIKTFINRDSDPVHVPIEEISDAPRYEQAIPAPRYEQPAPRFERESINRSFTINHAAPKVQNITIQNLMQAPVQQMMMQQAQPMMMMPVQQMYQPMMMQQAPMYQPMYQQAPMYQQMPYQQSQQMMQCPSVQNMTSFGNYPRY